MSKRLSTYSAWVVAIAAVAGGIWLLRRGRNSTPTLVKEYDMRTNTKLPRGYRNNNPLNIRKSNEAWKGKVYIGNSDGTFEQFYDMAYGYRAALVLLRGPGYIGKGLNTIEKIITKFAPPEENDTAGYIADVSRMTGIPKDQVISRNDKDALTAIVYAMSICENGTKEVKPYSGNLKELYNLPNMEIINQGWELI